MHFNIRGPESRRRAYGVGVEIGGKAGGENQRSRIPALTPFRRSRLDDSAETTSFFSLEFADARADAAAMDD
jgi:hypothetical protein